MDQWIYQWIEIRKVACNGKWHVMKMLQVNFQVGKARFDGIIIGWC